MVRALAGDSTSTGRLAPFAAASVLGLRPRTAGLVLAATLSLPHNSRTSWRPARRTVRRATAQCWPERARREGRRAAAQSPGGYPRPATDSSGPVTSLIATKRFSSQLIPSGGLNHRRRRAQ